MASVITPPHQTVGKVVIPPAMHVFGSKLRLEFQYVTPLEEHEAMAYASVKRCKLDAACGTLQRVWHMFGSVTGGGSCVQELWRVEREGVSYQHSTSTQDLGVCEGDNGEAVWFPQRKVPIWWVEL
jgi:hypothetical protein